MRRSLLWALCLSAPVAYAQSPEPPPEAERPASGFPGMGGPGGGMGGPGISATWMPSQRVKNQNATLGWIAEELSLAGPLWTNGQTMLMGNLGVGSHQFSTSAILPDSRMPFPDQLWNLRAGVMAMHPLGDGWMLGGGVNVGSASDKPFSSLSTVNAGINAMLRIPWGESDSWMLGVMYSPLGQLPFPVPMVSYSWNPSEQFSANIGLPLSVRWKPEEHWTLEASYMILTTIRVRATCRFSTQWTFFGGFDWTNQAWFLSDEARARTGTGDRASERFLYYEKRIGGGVRWKTDLATLELGAGYAFDRFFTQGSLLGTEQRDRLPLRNGPYLSAGLRW